MATLAAGIRRHFLWLLLATYTVSAAVPGPGVAALRFDFTSLMGPEWQAYGGRATLPLLLVALLLFFAAVAVDLAELRVLLRRPVVWLLGVAGVWVGPAVVVAAAGMLLPGLLESDAATGLMLGATLLAAMPVANSSVAWTQQSGGSLPWSLGLVVLPILLTPWVTPALLRLSGMSLSGGEAEFVEHLVGSFSGVPFIVWVLLPTAAGLGVRRVMGAEAIAEFATARQLASSAVLIALNYITGAAALPQFFQHPSAATLTAAAVIALALAATGVLLATLLGAALGLDRPTTDAMRYALSMKNTGLSFALAVTAGLAECDEAILLIVVTTPVQHLVSSLVDRVARRRAAAEA